MWRSFSSSSSRSLLLRNLLACRPTKHPIPPRRPQLPLLFSSSSSSSGGKGSTSAHPAESITVAETKRLLRLADVESLKRKLAGDGKEVIGYSKFLETCEGMGVAGSRDEAAALAHALDDAGVVLLFRDRVYLHPQKVADVVRRAVVPMPPPAQSAENDPRKEELKQLRRKKEKIDAIANRQVRRALWTGLGIMVAQISLFFRLTFWDYSWDVMEPIAYFCTASSIIAGYGYFLCTSRDPTYEDLRRRMFSSRQRRLFLRHNFDVQRYMELQKRYCSTPLQELLDVDQTK